jgi:hypothetical protein
LRENLSTLEAMARVEHVRGNMIALDDTEAIK